MLNGTETNLDQKRCQIGKVICYKTHTHRTRDTNGRWKERRGEKDDDHLQETPVRMGPGCFPRWIMGSLLLDQTAACNISPCPDNLCLRQ